MQNVNIVQAYGKIPIEILYKILYHIIDLKLKLQGKRLRGNKMDLKAIISKMTLKQKLAQLTQVNIKCVLNESGGSEITGPAMELGLSAEDVASMGSVLNFSGAGEMIKAQKEHLETDPNKIPMLFMSAKDDKPSKMYAYKMKIIVTIIIIDLKGGFIWQH